jgi:hypothetical protein
MPPSPRSVSVASHGAAETFQEEDRVGKLAGDAGDDVLPDVGGDLVAGVAAEAVDAAAAPFEEGVGDEIPEDDVALFEFDEVFPDDAPGAGAGEAAVGFAPEEFGSFLVEPGAPAGVIDDDVEEHARVEQMGGAGEFAELVDAGRAAVELHQGGIDGGEIEGGIGAAHATEPGEHRGGGVDREEVDDATAQALDDVGELAGEVAEGSGGGQGGVAATFQVRQHGFLRLRLQARGEPGLAEEAGEGAVEGVSRPAPVGVDGNPEVGSGRPMLAAVAIQQVRLGGVESGLGEHEIAGPIGAVPGHGQVVPAGSEGRDVGGVRTDDFVAQNPAAAEVGAQSGPPARVGVFPAAGGELESEGVAHMTHQALSRGGRHEDRFHGFVPGKETRPGTGVQVAGRRGEPRRGGGRAGVITSKRRIPRLPARGRPAPLRVSSGSPAGRRKARPGCDRRRSWTGAVGGRGRAKRPGRPRAARSLSTHLFGIHGPRRRGPPPASISRRGPIASHSRLPGGRGVIARGGPPDARTSSV